MIKNTNNIMPEGVAISTPHKSHTNIENSVNYSNLFLVGTFMGDHLPLLALLQCHIFQKQFSVARMVKILVLHFLKKLKLFCQILYITVLRQLFFLQNLQIRLNKRSIFPVACTHCIFTTKFEHRAFFFFFTCASKNH